MERAWTELEEKRLELLFKHYTPTSISKILDRTRTEIVLKSSKLGLFEESFNDEILDQFDICRICGISEEVFLNEWVSCGGFDCNGESFPYTMQFWKLCDFMKDNRDLWEVDKCDPYYFKDFIWFQSIAKSEEKKRKRGKKPNLATFHHAEIDRLHKEGLSMIAISRVMEIPRHSVYYYFENKNKD